MKAVVWVGLCLSLGLAAPLPAQEAPLDPKLKNPWPAEWEKEFQKRGRAILEAQCKQNRADGLGGRTYFENEKRAYGLLMAHLVAGDREKALKEIQREDAQAEAWHRHTKGIDYYACFTLKHQIRKYFLFGDKLDPAYRKRMFEGARLWTEQDPLRRPHPAYKKGTQGWGPDAHNSWVDIRSTENLFLMRVTSVYLMAEETGNEETWKKYRQAILDYVATVYRVGIGEWDSENYHGHSVAPLLNLHDFAKDAAVRQAAKVCLDYFMAAGAVKYYRGAFNGPTKRDYSHPQPFGGSAANMLWVYFGDTPLANTEFESDEVHALTSGYRPPAAVVHLARKDFKRPAEVFAAKPHYTASTGNDRKSPPEHLETHYFGRTFQMGSLVGGTSTGKSDVNGFKILVGDRKKGALAVQGVPGPDPAYVGSPKYTEGKVSGPNRVAQNGNVALWLVEDGKSPWVWVVPESIAVEEAGGITFLRADGTWVALRPLNASECGVDEGLTKQLTAAKDGKASPWAGHRVLSARGKGGKYCGFAIEVGEAPDFADYAAFKAAVIKKAVADVAGLAEGQVGYTGAGGRSVKMQFKAADGGTTVWRDGKPHDWKAHAGMAYGGPEPDAAPIRQDWLGGKLTVRAGGTMFTATVEADGTSTFRND